MSVTTSGTLCAVGLLAAFACADDASIVSPAEIDRIGFLVHEVQSSFQSGKTQIRVLLPDPQTAGRIYPAIYVLPVEAKYEHQYGDGLSEIKSLDLQNRFQAIFIAPTFSQVPWYADHPTNPTIRQETYFLKVVVPFADEHYPVQTEPAGRLLLGFSKSGWGAWTLLLRHPDVFGRAAAWDAPLMMDRLGRYGTTTVFDTRENFDRYRIDNLLRDKSTVLTGDPRLILTGYDSFRAHLQKAHSLLDELRIPHIVRDGPKRKHDWHGGWVEEAVQRLLENQTALDKPSHTTSRHSLLDRYPEYESALAALQVVFVMLGMGATLSVADFVTVARRPRSLLVGCACQFLVAPVITLLALRLCRLDAGIAVGLILIAAMPGGPLANLFTFLAQGNVALSIALTGVGTLGSLLSVPILLSACVPGYVSGDFAMPAGVIVGDVAGFLVAPVAVGMMFRRFAPRWSPIASVWLVRAGLLVLVCIVVGSLGSGRISPLSHGWTAPAVIIALCLVIQNLCMAIFPPLRWPVADQTAVGVGVTIRNVNLALLLAARLFPASGSTTAANAVGGGVLYVVLFWGALSLVVCTPTIFVQRRALAIEELRLRGEAATPS